MLSQTFCAKLDPHCGLSSRRAIVLSSQWTSGLPRTSPRGAELWCDRWSTISVTCAPLTTTQLRKLMAQKGASRGTQDQKEDYIAKLKARATGTPYVNKPSRARRAVDGEVVPAKRARGPPKAQGEQAAQISLPRYGTRSTSALPARERDIVLVEERFLADALGEQAPHEVTLPLAGPRIEDGFGEFVGAPLPPPPALVDSALPPPAALLTNADGMTPASLLQARIDEAICTEGIPNCFTSTSGADMRQFVVSATDGVRCSICCDNAWSSRTPLVTLLHDLRKHCGQYATRSLPETKAHLRRLRLLAGAPMVAGDSSSLDVPPAWTDAAAALAATAAPDPSRLVFSPARGPHVFVAPALAPAAWATAAPLPAPSMEGISSLPKKRVPPTTSADVGESPRQERAPSPKKRAPPTASADEHKPLQERVEKKPRTGRCSPSSKHNN